MLSSKDSLRTTLFRHQPTTSPLSNDSIELIGKRQQGRSMLVVRGQVPKHATFVGADPTCLGRWKHVDLVNRGNKMRVT